MAAARPCSGCRFSSCICPENQENHRVGPMYRYTEKQTKKWHQRKTALIMAVENKMESVVMKLLESGASVSGQMLRKMDRWIGGLFEHRQTVPAELLRDLLRVRDSEGRTALMWDEERRIEERRMPTLMQKLVDKGADCGITDQDGSTSLMLAISANHQAAAEVLLEPTSQAGALHAKDSEGRTALMMASSRGMVTLTQKLVDKGADCGITDQDGSTSLMLAISANHQEAAELLLEPTSQAGALHVKDSEGRTALMVASSRGMVTLMQKLVDKGADCGIAAQDGSTSLMLAISAHDQEAAELLVERTSQAGALDAQDSEGRTALMMANERGMVTLIQKLVDKGANVNAQDQVMRGRIFI